MPRHVLDEAHIHPAVRERIASHHRAIVDEVRAEVAVHAVVVVGMRGNPFPRRARRLLQGAGIAHRYMEYGSYLGGWRQRTALKLWTGWPTLPLVFVNGQFIGGADDLKKLHTSGELARLLVRGAAAPAPGQSLPEQTPAG